MSAIAASALWSAAALGAEEFPRDLAQLEREARYPGRCAEATVPVTTRDGGGQSALSIVLPKGYAEQPEKRYAVMYGVLDGAGSNAGRYNIVEAADRLQDEGFFDGLIVIHINSGNLQLVRDRWWPDHVVKDIIPYVDSTYRTVPDAAHRATAGSSGRTYPAQALVSLHPDVVGNVLVVAGATRGIADASPAVKGTRWFILIGARDMEPFTITGLDEFAKAGWTYGDNYCVQFATGPTFGNLTHGQAKIAYGIRSALRFFFRKEPGPMPVTSAQIVPFLDYPTCVFRPQGRAQFQPVRNRFDIDRDSMADWQAVVQLMSGDDFVMHYPDWSVLSSGDSSLLTVGEEGAAYSLSQNGRLRARGVGTTLVRASIPYGGRTIEASAQVNVAQPPPAGAPKGTPYVAGGRANETPQAGCVAYAVKSGRLLSGTLPGGDPDGDRIRYRMLFSVGQRWFKSVGASPDDRGAVMGPGLEVEGLAEAIKTDLPPGKVDEHYMGNVLITDEYAGRFSVYSNAGAVGWASCIYNTSDGYAQSNPASAVFYFGTEELAVEPGEVTFAMAAGQAAAAVPAHAVVRLTGSGSYKRYRYGVSDLPAWLNAEVSGEGDVRAATLSLNPSEAGKLAPGAHAATVRAYVNRGVRKTVLPITQDAFLFPDDVLRQGAYAASDGLAGEGRLVLKFDLKGLRGQVHSAVLRMYGQFDVPFQLRAAAGSGWSEGTVSLENAPGAGEVVASFPVLDRGTFIQPPGPGNNGAWAEVDITSAIEAARRGDGVAGFCVVNTTSERRWVHAREDLDFPPVLIVYCDDPAEPGTSRDIRVTLNVGAQAIPQAGRP